MSTNLKYETKVFKCIEIKDNLSKPRFQRHFIWAKRKKIESAKMIEKALELEGVGVNNGG